VKTTPKRNDAFQARPKSNKQKGKTTLKEKQIHSQEDDTPRKDSTTLKPDQNRGSEDKTPFIREIKHTHSKNGRY